MRSYRPTATGSLARKRDRLQAILAGDAADAGVLARRAGITRKGAANWMRENYLRPEDTDRLEHAQRLLAHVNARLANKNVDTANKEHTIACTKGVDHERG